MTRQFGNIKLIRGDCMDYLRTLPDGAFELAVVDPPYGLPSVSSKGSGKLKGRIFNKGNISRWDVAPTEEYFEQLRRVSINQIVWGGNYFTLPPSRGIICWDKCQPWQNFSQVEMAWTSFNRPAALFKFNNRIRGKIHPTQKPVELYKWLLTRYAKPGDSVLDTHLGSGSSAIAAWELGFDFVGVEIDSDYYINAVARLERHILQTQLNYTSTT